VGLYATIEVSQDKGLPDQVKATDPKSIYEGICGSNSVPRKNWVGYR